MKIVKNGRVYDLDLGAYETVCDFPLAGDQRTNGVGNPERVSRVLRKDKRNSLFYVLEECAGAYARSHYKIIPVSEEEARQFAEDRIDYDEYVKFFGDPEGGNVALERERDDAVKARDKANDAQSYWYEKCRNLEAKLSEIQEKLKELETGADIPEDILAVARQQTEAKMAENCPPKEMACPA